MSTTRRPFFERLPEVYRTYDQELAQGRRTVDDQPVAGPLQAFLETLDEVFGGIHDNIEEFYHDLFIETCADWVVPYIADLLGTSHLAGDPWTIRADVARTVGHRRRKGTLGAIESLTFTLTGWAVHAVEMRERMLWNQHLNHQRPDAGGIPPLTLRTNIEDAVRGGTITLRSPTVLSFLDGPFEGFAHVADVKPPANGAVRYNLPVLAVFLWRLKAYQLRVTQPVFRGLVAIPPAPGAAAFGVRFDLDPTGHTMKLFNTFRYQADDEPPLLTSQHAVPGPMPMPALSEDAPMGNPDAYARVNLYSNAAPPAPAPVGLTMHIPEASFPLVDWNFRGANLCAWEQGLNPPLATNEIAIDPRLGRVVFGVDNNSDGATLRDNLLASPTYGFSGPTGAHPISRMPSPATWMDQPATVITVNFHDNPNGLTDALADLPAHSAPLIIEIDDSMTHDLDINVVTGIGSDGGRPTLLLARSLWIRAATGQRPVIRLARPLAFRPADITGPGAAGVIASLTVQLEGLFITQGAAFAGGTALIEQATLNALILNGSTLDPGGQLLLDGTPGGSRAPMRLAMRLTNTYGLSNSLEEAAFDQIPLIQLLRSVSGALQIDDGYSLDLTGSIVDGGSGILDTPGAFAVSAATGDPNLEWGPALTVEGMTAFGRMRVEEASGDGGIWLHRLEVHDNQKGCIRFSYVSGDHDRLPPWHGVVFGTAAKVAFTSELYGEPGYAQMRLWSGRRILEEGPERDEMGAFGYLRNAHKWKNINIRYREFMPVGTRPILTPVT